MNAAVSLFAQSEPNEARGEMPPVLRSVIAYVRQLDARELRDLPGRWFSVRGLAGQPIRLKNGHILLASFAIEVKRGDSFEPIFQVRLSPRGDVPSSEIPSRLLVELMDMFGATIRP